jgi:hypothetical protein
VPPRSNSIFGYEGLRNLATLFANGFSHQVWNVRKNAVQHVEEFIFAVEHLGMADP